ncbi:MAG: septum formation protein Maf [Treponematales bacterium]
MDTILLASGSPQRRAFFQLLGLPFTAAPSGADETVPAGAGPEEAAKTLAERKALAAVAAAREGGGAPRWVCAADTLAAAGGRLLGKPSGRDDAGLMLRLLAGRSHEVVTAVALWSGGRGLNCRAVRSAVSFAPLSPGEIDWYLDTGEWRGAAGAYRIQGLAGCFITRMEGSYSAVAGLPLREFYGMLRDNGYPFGETKFPPPRGRRDREKDADKSA